MQEGTLRSAMPPLGAAGLTGAVAVRAAELTAAELTATELTAMLARASAEIRIPSLLCAQEMPNTVSAPGCSSVA